MLKHVDNFRVIQKEKEKKNLKSGTGGGKKAWKQRKNFRKIPHFTLYNNISKSKNLDCLFQKHEFKCESFLG